MRDAISLAALTTEGLLLVNKKGVWILPGGKPLDKEIDYNCLVREITKEELPNPKIKITCFYKSFIGKTPFSGDYLENKVYFGVIKGKLNASAEIKEARYVKEFKNYNLSDITKKIVDSLKKDKYL